MITVTADEIKHPLRSNKSLFVLELKTKAPYVTTHFVSSNLTHDEVYSIQHYVIKFVSDLLELVKLSFNVWTNGDQFYWSVFLTHGLIEFILKARSHRI
jgi:hypothetical protein